MQKANYMADMFTTEKRSWVMSRVGSLNTKPELVVRKILHKMGYRFRTHRRDLPGVPDIVLPKYRTVVFVHGCFWHGHNCRKGRLPSTNNEFWSEKVARNKVRDHEVLQRLAADNWNVILVWECQLSDRGRLRTELDESLKHNLLKLQRVMEES